ncbi:MAG TPA: prepilin-type N-terminal cleavage/methylation domain-containing protein [Patescibacteria group bacterium]|nr:prepilin-type N-terminal cleavage/methylation domain-containing protein [Patescibacteria group bacterium]
MKSNENGFTLVELMSVIIVTGIFVTVIMFFMFNFWTSGYLMEADLDTFVSRLNAEDYIRNTVGESSGLINQNSIPDANTENVDPANGSGNYWIPIHAVPGNTPVGSPGTTTPLLYFRRYSQDNTGAFIMNGNQHYDDEYVFYLNGSTKQLLARTLANPNASGDRLKTTCPPNLATSTCPADKVISSFIASVDTRYFSRTGNLVNFQSIWDPNINGYAGPDFAAVDVLELTLNLTTKPVFQKTNATVNNTIIRIALRNT